MHPLKKGKKEYWFLFVVFVVVAYFFLNICALCFDWNLSEDNGVVNPEEAKPEEVEMSDRMEEGCSIYCLL